MNEVYLVYKLEWHKDDVHKLDKIFANKDEAEKYCEKKEKAIAKKGYQYEAFSEWYVEPMAVI